jgi:intracellular septation protein
MAIGVQRNRLRSSLMLNLLKAFRPIAADFLSTIIFLVVLVITDNVVLSTSVGIAIGVAQFLWMRFRGTKIEVMQWASLALVIVLGSATILTQDARFMMVKPSIGAFAIACVMLKRGWQSRYFPAPVKENVPESSLVVWGYVWSALYFTLSVANLFVAFKFGRHVWEAYTAFVPTLSPLALFVIQYATIRWMVIRNIRAHAAMSATSVPAE